MIRSCPLKPVLGRFSLRLLAFLLLEKGFSASLCPNFIDPRDQPLRLHSLQCLDGVWHVSPTSPEELYEKMLDNYIKIYGARQGKRHLEEKINSYINEGFSREEAIREVAKEEGYVMTA